jgi:hypothetical protein
MRKLLCLALLCLAGYADSATQELELPQGAIGDDAALARAMPELAKQTMAIYREPDRNRYLNVLFRLQIVAGQYQAAAATLQNLKELRQATDPASVLSVMPFEVLVKARIKQAASGLTLDEAFKQEFVAAFNPLSDKTASEASFWFGGGRATTCVRR